MAHWSDAYVGLPYVDGEFDCAELARTVQLEVFRRAIDLPTERQYLGLDGVAKVRAMNAQLAACRDDYGVQTSTPQEGDAVLIVSRGRLDHIGLYCLINGEAWVLHAASGINQVVRTRLRELPLYGYSLEGFYAWK
jgi:hypothetical protein